MSEQSYVNKLKSLAVTVVAVIITSIAVGQHTRSEVDKDVTERFSLLYTELIEELQEAPSDRWTVQMERDVWRVFVETGEVPSVDEVYQAHKDDTQPVLSPIFPKK